MSGDTDSGSRRYILLALTDSTSDSTGEPVSAEGVAHVFVERGHSYAERPRRLFHRNG